MSLGGCQEKLGSYMFNVEENGVFMKSFRMVFFG